jgi:hypothetical protein
MKHYIVQRKWLLHTFGDMEWWGIHCKKSKYNKDKSVYYKIGQSAWQPAPIDIRTYFIIAYVRYLWLIYTDKEHEYRVVDAREEYPGLNLRKTS